MTGSVAFTNARLQSPFRSLGQPISTSNNISGLKIPRFLENVSILPVNVFAGYRKYSHSVEVDRGSMLV